MFSHFNEGASCPAYVNGLNTCLRTGADCSNAKNWEVSSLVRACVFGSRTSMQGTHTKYRPDHRPARAWNGTQVDTAMRATSPRSTSGSPGTSLQRPVVASPSDSSSWEVLVLPHAESTYTPHSTTSHSAHLITWQTAVPSMGGSMRAALAPTG